MATVSTEVVDTDGLTPNYPTASSGGDQVAPSDHTFIHVKNGSASSVDVTLVTPQQVDGLSVNDRTVTVPAGGDTFIAVPNLYRNSSGMADITWSATSSVTFAVLRV